MRLVSHKSFPCGSCKLGVDGLCVHGGTRLFDPRGATGAMELPDFAILVNPILTGGWGQVLPTK